MREFARIETLAGVKRTVYNQYDSLVLPLQRWLERQGVRLVTNCIVTDLEHASVDSQFSVTAMHLARAGEMEETIVLQDRDLVFLQNGSVTDASSVGSMSAAPAKRSKDDGGGWALWERLAQGRPQFGKPSVFNSTVAQSWCESFTVTLKDSEFFDQVTQFTGNVPGTHGLISFKDSNCLMSIVLPHQPHFINQPADVQVF